MPRRDEGGLPGYDLEATFYDYGWESLKADLRFYARRLKGYRRVLDCMCGTGRVTLALARAGFEVEGVDSSTGMLYRARRRLRREAASVRGRVRFVRADLRKASLGPGHDAAIIAVNSYGLILSRRDRVRALRRIRAALRRGGRLLLALDSVRSYRRIRDGVPFVTTVRTGDRGRRTYVRIMAETGARADRVRSPTLHLLITRSGGLSRAALTETITAVLSPAEVKWELRRSGFRQEQLLGGYDGRPYSPRGELFILDATAV